MHHRLIYPFCCLLYAVAAASTARADLTYTQTTENDHDWTVIRMTVTPAAESIPALKHRFIARDIDLKPGNAAPFYYRALMELPRRLEATRKKYNEYEELSKWYGTGADALPVDELPLEKVRDAVEKSIGWGLWEQLSEAAHRRDCDWELGIEEMRGIEVISFLLPEFQQSREVARMLSLRTRLAIAERRYDDAIDTMRMNYRLGRDVAGPPLFVCGLIGIAISSLTNGTLIELIAAPDSPNLYWALTELSESPIDMRASARFELNFGPRMFPFIHNAETTDRAPQEWNRLFSLTFRDLQEMGAAVFLFGEAPAVDTDVAAGITATGVALLGYPHAKQQLIAEGMDPEQVERMAVGQVIAIYTERIYDRFADDFEKLWYVPFWEMRERVAQIEQELHGAALLRGGPSRELLPLVQALMPAMHAARTAQVRLERDIAAMRVIEALRMHAAENDGRLPGSLDDIEVVPIPLNPATGQPFVYRLDGQTGVLELPPSDRIPAYNRSFEIQIATNAQ